ncbi:hypothetical protein BJX99DRAFT_255389 [Aspergillus californicus]
MSLPTAYTPSDASSSARQNPTRALLRITGVSKIIQNFHDVECGLDPSADTTTVPLTETFHRIFTRYFIDHLLADPELISLHGRLQRLVHRDDFIRGHSLLLRSYFLDFLYGNQDRRQKQFASLLMLDIDTISHEIYNLRFGLSATKKCERELTLDLHLHSGSVLDPIPNTTARALRTTVRDLTGGRSYCQYKDRLRAWVFYGNRVQPGEVLRHSEVDLSGNLTLGGKGFETGLRFLWQMKPLLMAWACFYLCWLRIA